MGKLIHCQLCINHWAVPVSNRTFVINHILSFLSLHQKSISTIITVLLMHQKQFVNFGKHPKQIVHFYKGFFYDDLHLEGYLSWCMGCENTNEEHASVSWSLHFDEGRKSCKSKEGIWVRFSVFVIFHLITWSTDLIPPCLEIVWKQTI